MAPGEVGHASRHRSEILAVGLAGLSAFIVLFGSRAWNKQKIRRKPQQGFKHVLADNTDTPFAHLAPAAGSVSTSDVGQQRKVEAIVQQQKRSRLDGVDYDDTAEEGREGERKETLGVDEACLACPVHPYSKAIQALLATYDATAASTLLPDPTAAAAAATAAEAVGMMTGQDGCSSGIVSPAQGPAEPAHPHPLHCPRQPCVARSGSCGGSVNGSCGGGSSGGGDGSGGNGGGIMQLPAVLVRMPVLPPPPECVKLALVKTPKQLRHMAEHLHRVDAFAVDLEHNARRSYLGITCLIQISTGDVDYVVDALALHDHIGDALRPAFASPHILKVLHGCSQDVVWLQRDFHLYLVHVFDTEQAAVVLGRKARSLASLTLAHCGVELDKSYQTADWRQRPLPPDYVDYARADVRYLLYLCGVLSHELSAASSHKAGSPTASARDPQLSAATTQAPQLSAATQAPQLSAATTQAPQLSAATSQAPQLQLSPGPLPSLLAKALHRSQLLTLQLYTKPRHHAVVSSAAAALLRRALAQHVQQQEHTYVSGAACEPHRHLQQQQQQQQQQQRQQLHVGTSQEQERRSRSKGASTSRASHLSLGEGNGDSCRSRSSSSRAVLGHGGSSAGCDAAVFQRCLLALCDWRDWQARKDDEGLQFVLPDSVLLALARAAPTRAAGVLDVLRMHGPEPAHGRQELMSRAPLTQANQLANYIQGACSAPHRATDAEAGALQGLAGTRHADEQESLERLCASLGFQGASRKNPKLSGIDALPPEKREMMIKKFSTKGVAYENCVMLSQTGDLLCHTDRNKVEWYLSKGIAEKVKNEPLTIRLLFEHKKSDQEAGERFYSEQKTNRCVVCGEEEHYLRFRVVPACYRRQFPIHLKSHRSHDVVLLCVRCHQNALKVSEMTKQEVARQYGVPLEPTFAKDSAEARGQEARAKEAADSAAAGLSPNAVRRAAVALQHAGARMPAARRAELATVVKQGLQLSGWVPPAGGLADASSDGDLGDGSAGIQPNWGLSKAEIEAGLVLGLNEKNVKKLRSTQRDEDEEAGAEGQGGPGGGHMWHGQTVVRAILENEGELGLHQGLIRRFREAFVQACQPRFLPHHWDVGHAAIRQYGLHSVFASSPKPQQG